MFFNGWANILNVIVLGPLTYVALILLLQLSGKRTLSKMNAFDFVITIALGSIFASVVLLEKVAFVEGVAALVILVGLQYALTSLAVRFEAFDRLIKASPTLLYHDGTFVRGAMRRTRVSESEIYAAARENGHTSFSEVRAVVLENEGSFSVLIGSEDVPVAQLETLKPL